MFRLRSERPARRGGIRRRDLLRAGALAPLGAGLADALRLGAAEPRDVRCILLMLNGGPSQLDTFDMKPDAPAEIRGPFRPISTNVAGIEISEIFPRTARHADKFSLVRGVYHTGPATHEAGHQAIQTGRLFADGIEHPHAGCALAALRGPGCQMPAHVLLPGPVNLGGNAPHGQGAGYLGGLYNPFVPPADRLETGELSTAPELRHALDPGGEPEAVRAQYGLNRFGQNCLRARRLVERGVRFVTVNMFDSVFDQVTWDIHGWKPFSAIGGYRDVVGPMFDMAYASLLQELSERGLLRHTMVVATGEFGRTPRLNSMGGRDHWPQCWTVLMGGGPLRCGTVVGASDAIAAAPRDRPVSAAEVVATIYRGFGLQTGLELPGPEGRVPLVDPGVEPVRELLV